MPMIQCAQMCAVSSKLNNAHRVQWLLSCLAKFMKVNSAITINILKASVRLHALGVDEKEHMTRTQLVRIEVSTNR